MPLPQNLQEIIDMIASMSREEKLETLIAYAETLPDLPERFKTQRDQMESVPECMTPVFIIAEKDEHGGIQFYLDIPPQSPTVRGLASILLNGLNGCAFEEIVSVPIDFYHPMNLQEAVSQQRITGFTGVLSHMKQAAAKAQQA
ncbi:MAG: SufE family protein [Anaerolineales bacterium]|nr:SufE family protein [Anaerolineales bacterium]MCZ2122103.1 SufE family protein [Anaerolineales bacterium]